MSAIKKSKTIVTGGAGFIGSHVVEELMKKVSEVLVIDIKCHASSYFVKQKLNKEAKLEFIDIANKDAVDNIFTYFKPDYVFHLAAEAIVDDAYENPYRTFQTNVMGTVSVLEAARKSNSVKGVIIASSDKAYGKTKDAYTEESPLKGDHPYDVSKSCTDLIAQTYFKTYKLPVIVTRFGNVYGEGDLHLDRIIPGICEAVVKDKMLAIRSDGKYVRDYVYVKDVANGYLTLLKEFEKIPGEAYNFSSDDTYAVLDLVKKSEKILNKTIRYDILNQTINEIPYQHLDATKVKKLGWHPIYTINTTLPSILEWYERFLQF